MPDAFLRSGRPSLDLVWTVRYRRVLPTETLTDPAALETWLRGTYPDLDASEACDEALLDRVRDLREAVHDCVAASVGQRALPAEALAAVNEAAAGGRLVWQLTVDGVRGAVLTDQADLLGELAADAVDVLARSDRLRACEGPDCGLAFLDLSRAGTRRWCTAQRCGNRVNTRAYRARQRT